MVKVAELQTSNYKVNICMYKDGTGVLIRAEIFKRGIIPKLYRSLLPHPDETIVTRCPPHQVDEKIDNIANKAVQTVKDIEAVETTINNINVELELTGENENYMARDNETTDAEE